jgi:hypothetical protein
VDEDYFFFLAAGFFAAGFFALDFVAIIFVFLQVDRPAEF